MEQYVATFFSHFGAIRFGRTLRELGIQHALAPVPRKLSSSCGTCVRFTVQTLPELPEGDLERLFRVTEAGFEEVISRL